MIKIAQLPTTIEGCHAVIHHLVSRLNAERKDKERSVCSPLQDETKFSKNISLIPSVPAGCNGGTQMPQSATEGGGVGFYEPWRVGIPLQHWI